MVDDVEDVVDGVNNGDEEVRDEEGGNGTCEKLRRDARAKAVEVEIIERGECGWYAR